MKESRLMRIMYIMLNSRYIRLQATNTCQQAAPCRLQPLQPSPD